jgi:hypothetical protein
MRRGFVRRGARLLGAGGYRHNQRERADEQWSDHSFVHFDIYPK